MSASSSSTEAPYVIKIGGALLADEAVVEAIWRAVKQLRQEAPVVLVHGGGKQATELARQLDHEPRIVHGRRVTTDLDLAIVQWTMRGGANVALAAAAHRYGVPGVGVSGVDGGILRVHKRPPWEIDGEQVDFGWVGDVDGVETSLLHHLLRGNFVPIIAPLGVDDQGQVYNVNADTVALAVASALPAAHFLLVTDSGGVQRDVDRPGSLLAECDRATYEAGIRDGWIAGGMRVKLKVAYDALAAGIREVLIIGADDLLARQRCTHVVE